MSSTATSKAHSCILRPLRRPYGRTPQVDTVVFDKTGTLTLGKPQVTNVLSLDPVAMPRDHILQLAAAVEASTTHPVALAVVQAAR